MSTHHVAPFVCGDWAISGCFTPINIQLDPLKVLTRQPLHNCEEMSSRLSRDVFTAVKRPLHSCEEVIKEVLFRADALYLLPYLLLFYFMYIIAI